LKIIIQPLASLLVEKKENRHVFSQKGGDGLEQRTMMDPVAIPDSRTIHGQQVGWEKRWVSRLA